MIKQSQLMKATKWLEKKCLPKDIFPVAIVRGHAMFVAYVYKLRRKDKPNVWYCVDFIWMKATTRIRRICVK